MAIASAATRGFAAVRRHDERDALPGVPIDIDGRTDDGAFPDTPLPDRDAEARGMAAALTYIARIPRSFERLTAIQSARRETPWRSDRPLRT